MEVEEKMHENVEGISRLIIHALVSPFEK